MKDLLPEEYVYEQRRLIEKYWIDRNLAGCYLMNFEHDYICHKLNGRCKNIRKCRLMHMLEQTAKCEACGTRFVKDTTEGVYVTTHGLCHDCYDYFDGMQKCMEDNNK